MTIRNLKITGLYGHLDKTIRFHKDITLLVGINGSGKTSVLNLIKWLLKPDLPQLCVTSFRTLVLELTFKNTNYKITCSHKDNTLFYQIESDADDFPPLVVPISHTPGELSSDFTSRYELLQKYSHMGPEPGEIPTWTLVSKLPNPTVIGLDRNLYAEESENVYYESPMRVTLSKKAHQAGNPLDRAKELANREYRKRRNAVLRLTSELKNHLMFSTFEGSITQNSFTAGLKQRLDLRQIEAAEGRVNDYFNKFEKRALSDDARGRISGYFADLTRVTKDYQEHPTDLTKRLLYGLNANQFRKVNELLQRFEIFDNKANSEMAQITAFIETINYFFADSSKRIQFRDETSELVFVTLDKAGKQKGEPRDIRLLSSGEQQLLTLFAYIAFASTDGRLFIIDEPELSLHIKWQEEFLEQLAKVTPQSTQLILATHSPILAGKQPDKAIVLLPYNE